MKEYDTGVIMISCERGQCSSSIVYKNKEDAIAEAKDNQIKEGVRLCVERDRIIKEIEEFNEFMKEPIKVYTHATQTTN